MTDEVTDQVTDQVTDKVTDAERAVGSVTEFFVVVQLTSSWARK